MSRLRSLIHRASDFALLLRKTRKVLAWVANGCTGAPPFFVKRFIIAHYLKKHSLKVFIETGTYKAETLRFVARRGIQCASIELSQEFYRAASEKMKRYPNVSLYRGDSGKILPELLRELDEPACFWLDGHYSGEGTAKADLETPILAELDAILSHPVKKHVILIDDARCFDGTHDYPQLWELLRRVSRESGYSVEVAADVVRIGPVS